MTMQSNFYTVFNAVTCSLSMNPKEEFFLVLCPHSGRVRLVKNNPPLEFVILLTHIHISGKVSLVKQYFQTGVNFIDKKKMIIHIQKLFEIVHINQATGSKNFSSLYWDPPQLYHVSCIIQIAKVNCFSNKPHQ